MTDATDPSPHHPAADGVPLSEMIETLRSELQASATQGAGKAVAFQIDKVELELKVAVTRKAKGEAGVAFWVVKAGAAIENQQDSVHTFKLSLTPLAAGTGKQILVNAEVGPDGLPVRP